MQITKIKEGYVEVPKISDNDILKRGLYLLIYKDKVIKVGIYGEGVNSTNKSRFSSYRSVGKNLNTITYSNGSIKTMKILNEKLEIGEHIDVAFKALPDDRFIDGMWWKVDLYQEEKRLKNKYKHTLWLS